MMTRTIDELADILEDKEELMDKDNEEGKKDIEDHDSESSNPNQVINTEHDEEVEIGFEIDRTTTRSGQIRKEPTRLNLHQCHLQNTTTSKSRI